MNKLIREIYRFVINEDGGETVEWAGVVGIIIAIAVASYNVGLQTAIASNIGFIVNTIMAL